VIFVSFGKKAKAGGRLMRLGFFATFWAKPKSGIIASRYLYWIHNRKIQFTPIAFTNYIK